MALDEPRDGDEAFDDNGLKFVIEKSLLDRAKPLKVDYTNSAFGSGFSIASSLQMGASCATSCSGC